jgi:uncharacterized repeat protein (TIGR01451 family)
MPLTIRAASAAATATIGQSVVFTATVENTSQQSIENVTFAVQTDATLNVLATNGATRRGNDFVWTVPSFPPGVQKLQVQCECRQVVDKACCRFMATLAGGQTAQAQACLEITPGNPLRGNTVTPGPSTTTSRLNVRVDNRNIVSAGKVQQFIVQVSNEGDAAENDLALTVRLPAGTTLADGTAGPDPSVRYQQQPGVVRFDPLAELPPGRMVNYRINVTTSQSGPITLQGEVTSRRQSQPVQGSATVEVLPAE